MALMAFSFVSSSEERLAQLKAEASRLKAELAFMEQTLRIWESGAPEPDLQSPSMTLRSPVLRGEVGEAVAVLAAQERAEGGSFHRH